MSARTIFSVFHRSSTLKALALLVSLHLGVSIRSQAQAPGTIMTVIGNEALNPGDQFPYISPTSVAVDAAGNVLVTDLGNQIWKLDPAGQVSLFAGTGEFNFSGNGGPAADARLHWPYGISVAPDQTVYFSDVLNRQIRQIDPQGIINSVPFENHPDDSVPGSKYTAYNNVRDTAVDKAGNLYFCQPNLGRISKVDPAGKITILLGDPSLPDIFSAPLPPDADQPAYLAVGSEGTLYYTDQAHFRVRKLDHAGNTTTVAGTGTRGFSGDGGPAAAAQLDGPRGITLDASGSLFISDQFVIRKVSPDDIISTVAGRKDKHGFFGDGGPAVSAELHYPYDVAVDPQGNLYICDYINGRVRKVFGVADPISYTPPGDVNRDGQVSIADVLLTLQAAIGGSPLTPNQAHAADINGDGQLNMKDVTRLLLLAIGISA